LSVIANLLLLAGYRNHIQDYARRNRGQSLAEGLKWRVAPEPVIGQRVARTRWANPPQALPALTRAALLRAAPAVPYFTRL
jgi:hypothetical protein